MRSALPSGLSADGSGLKDSDQILPGLFNRVERVAVCLGWILVAVLACRLFGLPPGVADAL